MITVRSLGVLLCAEDLLLALIELFGSATQALPKPLRTTALAGESL